jgi:glycerol-3-phosphate O-acyltransferase
VRAPRPAQIEDEFGPLLRGLARRYFESVRFPADAEEALRRLHERGFVVHVMRSTSWVNYLYLAWALFRRGLPPVRAVFNLRRWFTRPWRRAAQRGAIDVRFTYARRQGGSGLVFLRRSALGVAEGRTTREDPFPALVSLARRGDRPVFLVPELLVWERVGKRIVPGLIDRLFGSPDVPGFLQSVIAFLRNYRRAQLRLGEPVDLRRFIQEHPDASDEVLARKVRGALHHHLARETRAIFGPPRKPARRVLEETMRDRALRRALAEHAATTRRSLETVEREARRDLEAIAAHPNPTVIGLSVPILDWVFCRIYDGIEVDEAGLERAMRAAARAPVVLCPSHKSHIDYLVLSWVLWNRGYTPPLVAAGANLSFWPLGWFLRRGGAFFLRRSFKDDRVYTASFKAWIKKLVHDGVLQEFFPEGGRSRTGKLLPARLGLFTWEVDAVLEGARRDLTFVPVAIDYEKVVECSSYSKELAGGEKKSEDLRGLLSAHKVLSASYGRIHLTFDEPLSVAEFARGRGLSLTDGISEEEKKGLVRALGHRVMWGIGRASTLTPQALVSAGLLAYRGRGIPARELDAQIVFLRALAKADGTRLSSTLQGAPSDPTAPGPIGEALRTFIEDLLVTHEVVRGESIYRPVDERRAQLSFYKNASMNWIAPRSLVASAILANGGRDDAAAIRATALFLSRLFKLEFIYRVGASFETIFDETVDNLEVHGLLSRSDGAIEVAPDRRARDELMFLADLLRDYLESYLIAAVTLEELPKQGSTDRKAFVKTALEVGRAEFLAGRVSAMESISRSNLENALAWFLERGTLVEEDRTLRRGLSGSDPNARPSLIAEIRRCLR